MSPRSALIPRPLLERLEARLLLDATPTLSFSSYLGDAAFDGAWSAAIDQSGNSFVVGSTDSPGWATTGDTSHNGATDIFIAKVSASGQLLWTTYLGGGGADEALSVATDQSGNAVLAGYSFVNGQRDAYVAKISASGQLLWSVTVGGGGDDYASAIASDSQGNLYLTGATSSADWLTPRGSTDAFLVKLNSLGLTQWATRLGSSAEDVGWSVAVRDEHLYVTGSTRGSNWTLGGHDTSYNGGTRDAFLARYSLDGAVLWSSYLGGGDDDLARGVAVDSTGGAVLVGVTRSAGVTLGQSIDDQYGGEGDGFIARFTAQGGLTWTSYLGHDAADAAWRVALDAFDNAYVVGETYSTAWSQTAQGFDPTHGGGGNDGFLAKVDAAGATLWASYLGGEQYDIALGVAVAMQGVWVVGQTFSADWTLGGFSQSYRGQGDAFVALVHDSLTVPPTAVELSFTGIAENLPIGSVVGSLSLTGVPAQGEIFSLVQGQGDTDNAFFSVTGASLTTNAAFNFEARKQYTVRLRAAQGSQTLAEASFVINVTNVNESPENLSLNLVALPGQAAAGSLLGTLSATDPDVGDAVTFELVTGSGDADNARVTLVGNELRAAQAIDFAGGTTLRLRLAAVDLGQLRLEQEFTLALELPPSDLLLSNLTVFEDQPAGTLVGLLSAADPNAGETFSYALVSGTGSEDNAAVSVVGTQLLTTRRLDAALEPTLRARLRVTDSTGLSLERAFVLTVRDFADPPTVNSPPTAILLLPGSLDSGALPGTIAGALVALDPDANETFTFELVEGLGSASNGLFNVVGSNVISVAALTAGSHTIRVRATDAGGLSLEQSLLLEVSPDTQSPPDVNPDPDPYPDPDPTPGINIGLPPGAAQTLDFGGVAVGQSSGVRSLIITNTGGADLTVQQFRLSDTGAPDDFPFVLVDGVGQVVAGESFTLAPGQTLRLDARFAPSAAGARQAQITFTTNLSDPSLQTVTLQLQGQGIAPSVVEPGRTTVSLIALDALANESGDTGVFRVSRTGLTDGSLPVQITRAGDARQGVLRDYTADFTVAVIIPAGQSFVDVTVTPINDATPEATESITWLARAAADYVVSAQFSSATIALLDDEPTLSLQATQALATEGGDPGWVRLSRSTVGGEPLTVWLSVRGDANPQRDYLALPTRAVIPAGAAHIDLPITALRDSAREQPESVRVTLLDQPTYHLHHDAGQRTATVSILDATLEVQGPGAQVGPAQLVIRALQAQVTSGDAALTLELQNVGLGDAPPLRVRFWLSKAASFGSPTQTVIAEVDLSRLAPHQTARLHALAPATSLAALAPGTYFLLVSLEPSETDATPTAPLAIMASPLTPITLTV